MKPYKEGDLFYVYILLCADGSYYVGMTNDVRVRIGQHAAGKNERSYTAQRLPVKVMYTEVHKYVSNAIRREKNLKTWTHEKKTALINGDFERLRQLSKKKFIKKI